MNFTEEFENLTARYIRYEVPTGAPTSPLNKDSVYLCNIAEVAVYGKADSEAIIGDVNNDGVIDVSDLVHYQRYLLKNEKLAVPENADINDDGVTDIFDNIALRHLVISKITN